MHILFILQNKNHKYIEQLQCTQQLLSLTATTVHNAILTLWESNVKSYVKMYVVCIFVWFDFIRCGKLNDIDVMK